MPGSVDAVPSTLAEWWPATLLDAVAVDRLDGLPSGVGWAEVGAVTGEDSTHCLRASSTVSATRWAVLSFRPRVIAT